MKKRRKYATELIPEKDRSNGKDYGKDRYHNPFLKVSKGVFKMAYLI